MGLDVQEESRRGVRSVWVICNNTILKKEVLVDGVKTKFKSNDEHILISIVFNKSYTATNYSEVLIDD